MFKKAKIFILLGSLACGAAIGQQIDGVTGSETIQGTASLNPGSGAGFHLRGILITQSSRAAMLNGKVLREGDVMDGAEILAIDEREVLIRFGSDERILRVGSTIVSGQSGQPAMHIVRNTTPIRTAPEQVRPAVAEPDQIPALAQSDVQERIHKVKQGETLSGIAEKYLTGNTTRNQVAIALFAANPHAFHGNINALRAGAELRIPAAQELQRQTPATATAAVVAQTDTWRRASNQPVTPAATPSEQQYGPVNYGETLSGIAERTLRDGLTLDQMMIALFDANPQAFNGNINALREGVLLRIPIDSDLVHLAGRNASAEVIAQTNAWRNRSVQQARPEEVLSQVTASTISSAQVLIPPFE